MRSAVSSIGVVSSATLAVITGTADTDYPITNLSDLTQPNLPCRIVPSTGAVAFSAVFAANQAVQMVALVNHTLPAGATVRARFYSDAAMTTVLQDVSATAIPTPLSDYRQTYPVALAAGLTTVKAVRIDIASAGSSIDIGAFEIAGLWAISLLAGAEFGFADDGQDTQLAGGASVSADPWRPRTMSGQLSLSFGSATDTAMDDGKRKGLSVPFVFVEDLDDVTARNVWLATHEDLSPLAARLYGHDTYPLRLREHAR